MCTNVSVSALMTAVGKHESHLAYKMPALTTHKC